MLEREPRRFASRDELEGSCVASSGSAGGSAADERFRAALDELVEIDADGRVGLDGQRPLPIGIVTWDAGGEREDGGRPTRPTASRGSHPPDRAAWRAWLIANHATSSGVHLVTWRRATGKPSVAYERRRRGGPVRRLGRFEGRQA